jgi:hypothetical protein
MNTLLVLPSLRDHGEGVKYDELFIKIHNIDETEAREIISYYELALFDTKNITEADEEFNEPSGDNLISYNFDIPDFIDPDKIINTLAISRVPRHSGIRAVFVDFDKKEILISTIVVYNPNYAKYKVYDNSLIRKLFNLSVK